MHPGKATCGLQRTFLPGEGNFSSVRATCTEKGAYPWGEQFLPGESDLYHPGTGTCICREHGLFPGRQTLAQGWQLVTGEDNLCFGRTITAWGWQLVSRKGYLCPERVLVPGESEGAFAWREPLVHGVDHLCWEWATKGLERASWAWEDQLRPGEGTLCPAKVTCAQVR